MSERSASERDDKVWKFVNEKFLLYSNNFSFLIYEWQADDVLKHHKSGNATEDKLKVSEGTEKLLLEWDFHATK